MPLGRGRLPVLAEIAAAGAPDARAWTLRRADHESLLPLLPRLGRFAALLLTGAGEAPSAAALALASVAASAGRRTVLVECDLGRPRLAASLGLAAQPGLHEYLRWEARPADILQPLILAGPAAGEAQAPLACICGGREASKTATLLGLGSFQHAVAKLRRAYELVVLCGPSVAADPDAAMAAARQADVAIAGLTKEQARGGPGRPLRRAVRRLPLPTLGSIAVEPADVDPSPAETA